MLMSSPTVAPHCCQVRYSRGTVYYYYVVGQYTVISTHTSPHISSASKQHRTRLPCKKPTPLLANTETYEILLTIVIRYSCTCTTGDR